MTLTSASVVFFRKLRRRLYAYVTVLASLRVSCVKTPTNPRGTRVYEWFGMIIDLASVEDYRNFSSYSD